MSDASGSGVVDGVDVDAVAAAVAGCSSVAHLTGAGAGDQIATFLPGRRVSGVRVTEDEVEVHIASCWGIPIPEVAAEVRAAVAPLAGRRTVAVAVDDIDDPRAALTAGAAPDAGEAEALAPGGGPIPAPAPS